MGACAFLLPEVEASLGTSEELAASLPNQIGTQTFERNHKLLRDSYLP
jgi:hypothetical protein